MTNRTIIVSARGHGKTHWMKQLSVEQERRITAGMSNLAAAMAETYERMADAFAPVIEAFANANLVPPPVPEDPRERALFLAQRRGTGPEKVLDRRPRRG